jgi:hypothetical protein
MNAPVGLWRGTKRINFFCRHLLALCVAYEHDGDKAVQRPRFAAYAGTLLRIHDTYCFLTAGHILREVEEALQSEKIEVKNVVLADTFGPGRFKEPIPFDLRNAKLFYIDDDDEGLDFGVILLEPYYVRLLAVNGIVAIEEQNWVRQSRVKFQGYAMLGLPEEFTSDFVTAAGEGIVGPTMFAIQRLASPPVGARPTKHERFVGLLDPALGLKSMKGMSGGPIFGFNFEERHPVYWVVALQSAWREAEGFVFGCPIPTLASLMTAWASGAETPA